MKNIITTHRPLDEIRADELQQSMDMIEQKLDMEIGGKQKTIERQELEIQRLHALLEVQSKSLTDITVQLSECTRKGEGNRQLINKLLNDIDRLNQDIEWYKRTYVKRSLLGVIKDKLK